MLSIDNAPTANLVTRREPLKRLLRNPSARLIVVHGPAGFGKTTLLRQYCDHREEAGSTVVWVTMDAHSADPAHFIRHLCEALDAETADVPPPRPEGAAHSIQEFIRRVRTSKRGLVVVIDDFELAVSAGLAAAINQLVRALPGNAQICIATRTIPAINLSRLQVLEQAVVLRADELRFNAAETAEFFKTFGALSPEEVAELHECTDGWPAALQCFRLCLRDGRLRHSLSTPTGWVAPELIDFLTANVFDGLAPALRARLLFACLPERVSNDLLVHLSGDPDDRDALAEIDRMGLFLTPDPDGIGYRFNNVFRRFLLSRLREECGADELRTRHRRIAEWMTSNGRADDAVFHYLDAGDRDAAAATLAGIVDRLVAEERLGMIVRCVDRLPASTLRRHENLLHAAGIAYAFRREFNKANAVVELLGTILTERGGGAEDWGFRDYVHIFGLAAQDRIVEMGATADRIMERLDRRHGFKYAVAFNAKAYVLAAKGDFDRADDALRTARPLHDEFGSLFGQAYQEAISATLLSSQGRLDEAIRRLKAALRQVEDGGATCGTAGAVIGAYLAEAWYERDRLDDAVQLLSDFGPAVEQEAIVDPLAVALATQARIGFQRGDDGGAREVLERAIYLGHRHDLPRLVTYARAELARQATLSGDLRAARTHLNAMTAAGGGEDGGGAGTGDGLIFFAGEAEAQGPTAIRLAIAEERHGEARAAIQALSRKARAHKRHRRLLKLNLLLAISLDAEGQTGPARRALIQALELGAPGGFVRSFLDEGRVVIRMLKETRDALSRTPDLPRHDPTAAHIERLLAHAGESTAPPVPAARGWNEEWDGAEEDDGGVSPQMFEQLTERERDILRLVAGGLPNKALADRLSLSANTVKWHMRNIFEKLHIANRMQAVLVARHFGLID